MGTKVTPYRDESSKKQQVARMFNNIAWRYDFLNHFLSLGIDRYWRKVAIRTLGRTQPKLILDIATGTGDLAIATVSIQPEKIYGVDISADMLRIGREKIAKKGLREQIELLEGDSEKLIFEDNKFDAVSVAFGVRNFENLGKGLKEMHRVLKPGGTVMILEFSQPRNGLVKALYKLYSGKITPMIGRMISKDQAAYSYLHESVEAFPYGEAFLGHLKEAGFRETSCNPLTFGIVSIYTAKK